MNINPKTSDESNPWAAPEGSFEATVRSVKTSQDGQVRLVFQLEEQSDGGGGDFFAGKSYTNRQYNRLESDLRNWLGVAELAKMASGDFINLEQLKSLKGHCAVITIEHKECGQPEPFRDITAIRPCGTPDDKESNTHRLGFRLSQNKDRVQWN